MKDEFRVITLDYDDIAWKECLKRIYFIMNDTTDIEKIKVYSSPLHDGYHLYVYMHDYIQWKKIMYLRRRWKDDGIRMTIDLMKTRPETKMIMFRSKTRKGYKYNEIFIGEFVKPVRDMCELCKKVFGDCWVKLSSDNDESYQFLCLDCCEKLKQFPQTVKTFDKDFWIW